MNPTIMNIVPAMARVTPKVNGIKDFLMPFAMSVGVGIGEEFATISKVHIMLRTVAARQSPANTSAVPPTRIIHRRERVMGTGASLTS